MPILFKASPKRNLQQPDDPPKFYPQAVKRQNVDLDRLAERVAKESTVSRADCYAVIISLVEQIENELKDGNYVNIKGLGTLSVRIKGTPSDDAASLTSKNIGKITIGYRPDKRLVNSLQDADFEKKS